LISHAAAFFFACASVVEAAAHVLRWPPFPLTHAPCTHVHALIQQRLLAALEPDERANVLLFQRAAPSVVNISTSAAAAPLFPLNLMQARLPVGLVLCALFLCLAFACVRIGEV
jgi:hypothetical protein